MFQWYAEASVCYAYLVDIEPITQPDWNLEPECQLAFERSKWWTRGWCLQELIAPRNVEFLASDWSDLGTKFSLRQLISNITGIRLQILMGASLAVCCAAEKMSWASTRETTRPEDVAYCLLGLFEVNMPLLYGEGSTKAFVRLQKEILAQEPDYSLLAWSGPCTQWRVSVDPTPALAVRPQQFHREMKLIVVDLQQSREGHHIVRWMQEPLARAIIARWEDLVFNPRMDAHTFRSKRLKDAITDMKKSQDIHHSLHLVQDPTNVTNRGLHARLFISHTNLEDTHKDATLQRLLAWTYIIHPHGLVCVWFDRPLGYLFADAVHARDEAASPILVPFEYLKSSFSLNWIYLQLSFSNEQQSRGLRNDHTLHRHVILVDETVAKPSLFVLARYPDPILYHDSPTIRRKALVNLEDIRLIGCCLIDFEPNIARKPSSDVFIVMVGEHSTTNQILIKIVLWDDWSSIITRNNSDEIAEEFFTRWEANAATSMGGFNDRASLTPANGGGAVKIRVPGRSRSDKFIISMSYIENAKSKVSKGTEPQLSSSVFVEIDQSDLVELEHEANVVFVPEIWKQNQYRPFQGTMSTPYVASAEGPPENKL